MDIELDQPRHGNAFVPPEPVAAAPITPRQRRAVRSGFAVAEDGVKLHWRAVGAGPLVVCCNGVGVSTFFWKYLSEYFRDRYTVVVWDYRGHGHSERALDPATADLSIGRHTDDLAVVLDAVGPGEAVVVGHSMGCQVSLEFYRRHPDRVAGLVLALGTAGRTLSTFFDFPPSVRIVDHMHRAAFRIGPGVNHLVRPLLESPLAWFLARKLSLVDPYYTLREDMLPYMEHLASLDTRLFLEAVRQTDLHDAWDVLPTLGRPLLVIAAENDKFTPMWCSRKMVADAPQAELLVLADASHAALVEQPDTINHRIERFLREQVEPQRGA